MSNFGKPFSKDLDNLLLLAATTAKEVVDWARAALQAGAAPINGDRLRELVTRYDNAQSRIRELASDPSPLPFPAGPARGVDSLFKPAQLAPPMPSMVYAERKHEISREEAVLLLTRKVGMSGLKSVTFEQLIEIAVEAIIEARK